ncbi:DUF4232 domain-containing protein [Amycolatopsis jiangsuensis]|uniref:DUF4232 domain-containing protein n=1 Tax=Amycolatopsis jiangsuensis TaxID=1181879 RepID=A0A840IZK8_9PSEU|nr:DUF4232 domain-containing protein [Amycolatopsis jiangsuensis]MBB4686727.1 hypothetical protein [Amycolatopsis jiangsuensis]
MIANTLRRTLAAAAVLATVGGAAALSATAANAAPSDAPLCTDADVTVTATPAPDHASGHHADILHYTAATPTTHCTVSGAPYDTVFYDGGGAPLGVPSNSADSQNAPQVTIDATHTASSYVVIPNDAEPGPTVASLGLHLPSDASRTAIGVAWPGQDLTTSAHFEVITQD